MSGIDKYAIKNETALRAIYKRLASSMSFDEAIRVKKKALKLSVQVTKADRKVAIKAGDDFMRHIRANYPRTFAKAMQTPSGVAVTSLKKVVEKTHPNLFKTTKI